MTIAGKLYRKTTLLQVIEEREEGFLVQNEGDPSDQWMISKGLFASSYVEAEPEYSFEQMAEMEATYGFEMAIIALKEGYRVTRKGWNGKGMFVYFVPPGTYPARTEAAKSIGESVDYNAYLAIKNVNGTVSTWVPSVNDCLSNDWMVLA